MVPVSQDVYNYLDSLGIHTINELRRATKQKGCPTRILEIYRNLQRRYMFHTAFAKQIGLPVGVLAS